MSVHPFGAKSSPSCAGFCLRKTADECESDFDPDTIETIRRNFYVDDCLKSVSDTQKATRLIEQLRDFLTRRSFRLTKFISNDVTVLASVPESGQQQRQRWLKPRRNVKVNDLVLMVNKRCSRGQWPMAVVEEMFADKDGMVRQVMVRSKGGKLDR